MHTQCPDCRTVFRVTPDQLRAADGRVRCGRCKEVFNANDNLVVHLPLESALPGHTPDGGFDEVNIETLLKLPDGQEDEPLGVRGRPDAAAAATGSTPDHPSPFAQVIAEERARNTRPPPMQTAELPLALQPTPAPDGTAALTFFIIGSLLLAALLAGQFAWFQRDRLALHAELRPWLERMCEVGECSLPPRRAPEAIQLSRRDIRSHPHHREALVITGTLINGAAFSQPYPEVGVTLHDLAGNPIASRRFRPEEYLAEGSAEALFGAREEAELRLEVADPDEHAVGFEFSFY